MLMFTANLTEFEGNTSLPKITQLHYFSNNSFLYQSFRPNMPILAI